LPILTPQSFPCRSLPFQGKSPASRVEARRFSSSSETPQDLLELSNPQTKNPPSLNFSRPPDKSMRDAVQYIESEFFAASKDPSLKVTLNDVRKKSLFLDPDIQAVLPSIQEVRLPSSKNIQNYGWYHPAKKGKPTFILSMGNAWPLEGMLSYAKLMKDGYGFLTYEYPGYGSTAGKPTEESLYRSLEAASDFLEKEKSVPISEQIAYGISTGGAVATHVAAQRPFKALILESTMTCFPDFVQSLLTRKCYPQWVPSEAFQHVQIQFDSISKIAQIKCPLLIMHGKEDKLIPYEQAEKLNKKTETDQKIFILAPKEGHCIDAQWSIPHIETFLKEFGSHQTLKEHAEYVLPGKQESQKYS
jgi:esterase/lipase